MPTEQSSEEVIERSLASNPVTRAMAEHADGRTQEQLGSAAIANALSSTLDMVSAEYHRTPLDDFPERGATLRALFMNVLRAKTTADWLADFDERQSRDAPS